MRDLKWRGWPDERPEMEGWPDQKPEMVIRDLKWRGGQIIGDLIRTYSGQVIWLTSQNSGLSPKNDSMSRGGLLTFCTSGTGPFCSCPQFGD